MSIPNKLNKIGSSKKGNTEWIQPIVAREVSNLGALWTDNMNIKNAMSWPHLGLDQVPSNNGWTGSQWQGVEWRGHGAWYWSLPDTLMVKKVSISQRYSGGNFWILKGRLYKDKEKRFPISGEISFNVGNNAVTDIVFEKPIILDEIYVDITQTQDNDFVGFSDLRLEGEYVRPKEWKPWVQPVLSSNGSYGVIERSEIYKGYEPWTIFDNDMPRETEYTNKHWAFVTSDGWFSWTLPVMLKIKKIRVYDNLDPHELDCQFYADPNNTKKIGNGFRVSKTYEHVDNSVYYEIIPDEPVITNYIKLQQRIVSGGWGGSGEIKIEADYYNPSKYSWIQPVVETAIPEVTATGGYTAGDEPYSVLSSRPAYGNTPYNSNSYYCVGASDTCFWMWRLKKAIKIYGFYFYGLSYTKGVQFFADEAQTISMTEVINLPNGSSEHSCKFNKIMLDVPCISDLVKIKLIGSYSGAWMGFSQLYILADEI